MSSNWEEVNNLERALEVLHAVGRAVLVAPDVVAMCRTIYQELRRVMPLDAGFIYHYNQANDTIWSLYSIDEAIEDLSVTTWNYRRSVLVSWVIDQRQILVFDDFNIEVPDRFPTAKVSYFGQEEKQSRGWITVPLLVNQELVGLLNLQSYEYGVYGPFEQYILQVLANPLAVAISNAWLLLSLEQTVAGLKIPIIPLTRDVLVVPLLGVLDQQRWEDLTEATLTTIGERVAGGILLDASGISSFDPHTIRAITTLIRAIDLLGAHSVVIGMRPELIQGMVQAGSDFTRITTARDLAAGLALLRRQLA